MRKTNKVAIAFLMILFISAQGIAGSASAQDKIHISNPNASKQTKKLFAYLQDSSGERILFGHQHAIDEGVTLTNKAPRVASEQSEIYHAVGDYPAIFGWDTLSLDGYEKPGVQGDMEQSRKNLVKSVQKAHELGGIVALSTHPHNFVTGNDFYDTSGNVVFNILPGGSHHEKFTNWLDNIALFASELKDKNGELIPVIFRPFHEQSGGWFWWGASSTTAEEYKELVRFTIEYLRDEKGVSNFLYAYSPNASFSGNEERYLKTYPGDGYIDILGMDQYDNKENAGSEAFLQSMVTDLAMISRVAERKGKIAAFSEFGYSPEGMKQTGNTLDWYTKLFNTIKADPDARKIAFMQTWANFGWPNNMFVPYKDIHGELGGDHDLLPDFQTFYEDEYSAFRDDVKGFYDHYGEIEVVDQEPFMHIVSPVDGNTIEEPVTKLRVKVQGHVPSKVTYRIEGSDDEVEMELDENGMYYTSDWQPSPSANGKAVHVTVKTYIDESVICQEQIKVFIKTSEMTVKKYTFDDNIDGIKTNGTYPEANVIAFEHAVLGDDGKLKFQVDGIPKSETWQELKMELTDLDAIDLSTVTRVKFNTLIPIKAGEGNVDASLRGIAQLPPDWNLKYGEGTTIEKMTELERVEIDGEEYGNYTAVIDITNQEKLAKAEGIALSLVGSGLDLSYPVYIDNIELISATPEEPQDPALVDDFESYLGDNDLLQKSYTLASGDDVSISLSDTNKIQGSYGMKYDYTLAGAGYAGVTKSLGNLDWSEYNALQFWLNPDGKNQKLVIQIKVDGVAYEAYPSLSGTEAHLVVIPFQEFVPAPWESEENQSKRLIDGEVKNASEFSIYVNAVDGSQLESTLYFDDIRVINYKDDEENPSDGESPTGGEDPGDGESPSDKENPAEGENPTNVEKPSDGEVPIEGEDPLDGEGLSNKGTPTTGKDPIGGESQEGASLGKVLPSTATNLYNYAVVGIILLLLGGCWLLYNKMKKSY